MERGQRWSDFLGEGGGACRAHIELTMEKSDTAGMSLSQNRAQTTHEVPVLRCILLSYKNAVPRCPHWFGMRWELGGLDARGRG